MDKQSQDQTEDIHDDSQKEIQHVTYIIGHGREIIFHRFELDLSPDQHVEMVIKARNFLASLVPILGRTVCRFLIRVWTTKLKTCTVEFGCEWTKSSTIK